MENARKVEPTIGAPQTNVTVTENTIENRGMSYTTISELDPPTNTVYQLQHSRTNAREQTLARFLDGLRTSHHQKPNHLFPKYVSAPWICSRTPADGRKEPTRWIQSKDRRTPKQHNEKLKKSPKKPKRRPPSKSFTRHSRLSLTI